MPAPDAGQVRQLAEPLDGAVLAERAMKDREDDVQGTERTLLGKVEKRALVASGYERHLLVRSGIQPGQPHAGFKEELRPLLEVPPSLAVDPEEHGLVLPRVEGFQDVAGGLQGHLVLRGSSTEDDPDPDSSSRRLGTSSSAHPFFFASHAAAFGRMTVS